jgi:hypothetical protein
MIAGRSHAACLPGKRYENTTRAPRVVVVVGRGPLVCWERLIDNTSPASIVVIDKISRPATAEESKYTETSHHKYVDKIFQLLKERRAIQELGG